MRAFSALLAIDGIAAATITFVRVGGILGAVLCER